MHNFQKPASYYFGLAEGPLFSHVGPLQVRRSMGHEPDLTASKNRTCPLHALRPVMDSLHIGVPVEQIRWVCGDN